jgi:hypothetical protein
LISTQELDHRTVTKIACRMAVRREGMGRLAL